MLKKRMNKEMRKRKAREKFKSSKEIGIIESIENTKLGNAVNHE